MRRFFFLQNSPVDCFVKPKELTELGTGRSQFVRAGVQRVQPFVHGYRECNTPVQVKGGSLAQLSGVSPLSTGYYLTQKAARNQLRCPSPLSGKSKRKGGTHVKLTRHNGRAGKNGVYNPKHNDRVLTLPTANTLTKNEPNKISIGTVTMASAISKIPKRKMSCLPLLKMWNSFFIVSGIVIL